MIFSTYMIYLFFIGYTLEITLNNQEIKLCSGENLSTICLFNGSNAFIWSVAPFFRLQLANSVVNNGCRSFNMFSFKTVTGQSTLTINGKAINNGTLLITCASDESDNGHTATVNVVGKRDVSTFCCCCSCCCAALTGGYVIEAGVHTHTNILIP